MSTNKGEFRLWRLNLRTAAFILLWCFLLENQTLLIMLEYNKYSKNDFILFSLHSHNMTMSTKQVMYSTHTST